MPFFETADGTSLAYEDYGSGTPIVFVSGWVLNAGMWGRLTRADRQRAAALPLGLTDGDDRDVAGGFPRRPPRSTAWNHRPGAHHPWRG